MYIYIPLMGGILFLLIFSYIGLFTGNYDYWIRIGIVGASIGGLITTIPLLIRSIIDLKKMIE